MSTGCRSWQRRSRYLRRTGAAAVGDGGDGGFREGQKIWARPLTRSRPLGVGVDMLPILEHPGTLFYEVLTGVCALTSATVALFSHFGNSLPFRGS